MPNNQIKTIYYLEPIGGHGGMIYYDVSLLKELAGQGQYNLVWVTCSETDTELSGVELWPVLKDIYGAKHKLLRGVNYIKGLRKLLKAFRQNDQDSILHMHFFTLIPADYWLIKQFRRWGGRVIITAHDVVPFDANILAKKWMKYIYDQAEQIIVHAINNKNELIELYNYPENQIAIVPQGNYIQMSHLPDVQRQAALSKLKLEKFKKIILFFGIIKPVKGVDVLLQAMPKILELHPDVGLVIAGRVWKDDFSFYENIINELKLQPTVVPHIRYIPDDEMPMYFQAADVVALPYRKVYNSAVLFTALSFGRPVVATESGGIAEVIQDGQTGFLVTPDNPEELASKINYALSNPEHADEVAEKGKQHLEREFSWAKTAQSTLAVYDQVFDA